MAQQFPQKSALSHLLVLFQTSATFVQRSISKDVQQNIHAALFYIRKVCFKSKKNIQSQKSRTYTVTSCNKINRSILKRDNANKVFLFVCLFQALDNFEILQTSGHYLNVHFSEFILLHFIYLHLYPLTLHLNLAHCVCLHCVNEAHKSVFGLRLNKGFMV